ncbi:AT-hook motif nuclear-localized protein 12 [Camellia lanceoleosa]|uniref:AT-hook motif nuclear-localized protein 12 n=1 Tax=Camellia lanceoleosa TaxID=1840588 RepID=A0ACC0HA30_9ERIC|nr:AT-hook motif nuclear-localized protein 12 [Camellia lanceoleosa]
MEAEMGLMRRIPPKYTETALSALLNLLPDHSSQLLSQVDQPLQDRYCVIWIVERSSSYVNTTEMLTPIVQQDWLLHHVLHVKIREDIASRVLSFSQQRPRVVCILSGNGAVSAVTLRQPISSDTTVTYEVTSKND